MKDQPKPIPNDGTPIWDLVIEDMKARDAVGRERYGTPLQTNNGRDALIDAYQEALDQVAYIRQEIEERKTRQDALAAALLSVVEIAKETHREWDADNDHRVGKILMALAGYRPGYRADIDAIHAAIAAAEARS